MNSRIKMRPSRKLGRPAGVEPGDTRSKIIDAAMACFARSGYTGASNHDIAQHAGLTSGSLYHYFDNKASLFREALREASREVIDEYLAACREAPDASSMDQLSLGLERVIELSRRRPGLMRFVGTAASEIERNTELEWLSKEEGEAMPNFFRALLHRARSRGELSPSVDTEAAVKMLIAFVFSLTFLHGPLDSDEEFALIMRTFKSLLQGDFILHARREMEA